MTSMGSPDTMPLTLDELRAIAGWAAACAARVIPLFEAAAPDDARPRDAIEAARAFADGAPRTKLLRTAAMAAFAAARDVDTEAATAAARSAGTAAGSAYLHPLATSDQTKHILAPPAYAALARHAATGDPATADAEIRAAVDAAPEAVRAVLRRMPAREATRSPFGALLARVDAALRA